MFEVEMKFPLVDVDAFVRQLETEGATPGGSVSQCDQYFNHPERDFENTDEAFRVRTIGDQHLVTYKGPVVDAQTKTRREIEVSLAGSEAGAKVKEIVVALGFRPVREVWKVRRTWHIDWQGRQFEIAVDDVHGLGQFAEFETQADEADRPAAVAAILDLVSRFRLPPAQRKSYLCLLLEKDREIP